jgi:hypothetical protein
VELKARIAAAQRRKTPTPDTTGTTQPISTAPAFREALSQVGDFDAVYKRAFENASNPVEKSGIARQYIRLYPRHAAKSQWLSTVVDLSTHFSSPSVADNQRRNKWGAYSRDVDRRRDIVRDNFSEPAHRLCEAFDEARIGLPPGWDEKLAEPCWAAAYRDPQLKRSIHRIISTHRHELQK